MEEGEGGRAGAAALAGAAVPTVFFKPLFESPVAKGRVAAPNNELAAWSHAYRHCNVWLRLAGRL